MRARLGRRRTSGVCGERSKTGLAIPHAQDWNHHRKHAAGTQGEEVARWVHSLAAKRTDATYELVDLLDFKLPLLDEPLPPMRGQYAHEHTKNWSAKTASFDGFVFVTPCKTSRDRTADRPPAPGRGRRALHRDVPFS